MFLENAKLNMQQTIIHLSTEYLLLYSPCRGGVLVVSRPAAPWVNLGTFSPTL